MDISEGGIDPSGCPSRLPLRGICRLALVPALVGAAIATPALAQTASRAASDVIVSERYHPGRELVGVRSATPQGAAADLGVALPAGVELGAGHTVDLFAASTGVRGGPAATGGARGAQRVTLRPVSYRGIPFAPGSDVMSVANAAGKLLTVRERNLPAAVDGSTPTVDRDAARRAALEAGRTHAMPADASAGEPRQEVFVDASGRGRLAWRVRIQSPSLTRPWARDIWVAAIAAPAVLADRNGIATADGGHVTVTAYGGSPLGGTTSVDLEDAFVSTAAGQTTTGRDGRFALSGPGGASTVAVELSGPFADIVNYAAGGRITASAPAAQPGSVDLAVNAASAEELAQTSAFVAVNRAHALVADFLPPGALARLPTHVNIDQTCNAFWNGSSLNFFRAGQTGNGVTCSNTAYSDVVMHEYGHGVDDAMGGILDDAYSEGFGDALAVIATRQSCVGRDFTGAGKCLRNAADVVKWTPGGGEAHAAGRPYAGFVWELITRLQQGGDPPDTAFETARQLVLGAAAANPANVADAVRLSFVADDNDGDLTTCSPHFKVLAQAADSRDIPRPPDCTEGGGAAPVAVSAPTPAPASGTASATPPAPAPGTAVSGGAAAPPPRPAPAPSGAAAATGILLAPQ